MTSDTYPPLASGRYRLVSVLGTGGMATVYRGYDTELDVYRAIYVQGYSGPATDWSVIIE